MQSKNSKKNIPAKPRKDSNTRKSNRASSTRVKSTKTSKTSKKRELIDMGRDKRYIRRDEEGRFKESDDVGRSLSRDVRRNAKTAAAAGQGDRGDRYVRRANEHMLRAWETIYEGRTGKGKASR